MLNAGAADAEVIPKDPEVFESIVRRMYIRKAGIEEFGETPGCAGCRCISTAINPTPHPKIGTCLQKMNS